MTAREIQIWSGSIDTDVVTNDHLLVKSGTRRAVQIYQANFSIGNTDVFGQLNNGGFEIALTAQDRHGNIKKSIFSWQGAIITIGAVVGVGVLDLTRTWNAPPSLILADYSLDVDVLFSNFTGTPIVDFQVYFKAVTVSDTQAVQLGLM